jgi:hypothetical protein
MWNYLIFKVLTAESMKMTAFCDVAPCSLVKVDRRFRGQFSALSDRFPYLNSNLHVRLTHRPDDGGSMYL